MRPFSLVLGVSSWQEQVLEWGFCQAGTMKGAESVCKGEIVTMDPGHQVVEMELERGVKCVSG